MENKTHYYSNSVGDTITTLNITETQSEESEGIGMDLPQGTSGERYVQVVEVDTLFNYTTNLLAEVYDGERKDNAFIDGNTINLIGGAEPDYFMLADYTDTITINNITYTDVYSQLNASQSNGIFVNVNKGLVAFIFEKDTFNLVNLKDNE